MCLIEELCRLVRMDQLKEQWCNGRREFPPGYIRRQDRPKTPLYASEGRAFSRDNELYGPNIHCSRQSIETVNFSLDISIGDAVPEKQKQQYQQDQGHEKVPGQGHEAFFQVLFHDVKRGYGILYNASGSLIAGIFLLSLPEKAGVAPFLLISRSRKTVAAALRRINQKLPVSPKCS